MILASASYTLWAITLFAQAGIAVAMLKKRLYREMPVFFTYTAFHVLRSISLFVVRQWCSATLYSYSYWTAEGVSALLGFAVIYELFSIVLASYQGIKQIGLMLFRWTFVMLVLIVIVSSDSASAKGQGIIAGILALERSVRVIQCGLLVFLFLFASTLALSWRQHAFGIAFGFGLFASVELITAAVRVQVGPAADQVYTLLKPGSYALATIIWTVYVLRPIPQKSANKLPLTTQVEEWNEAVLGLLSR